MIYLTLFIEAAIPIMLVVRRLRIAGLLLAFGFHFALAMDPGDVVFNFSAMLLALFYLFLPEGFSQSLGGTLAPFHRWWTRLRPPQLQWIIARAIVFLAIPAIVIALIFRAAIPTGMTFEASRRVWVVYAAFALATFLATLLRNRFRWDSASELLTVPAPVLLIFPALLVINGLLPYLGAKTETSFAMYSNLRTEGGISNHWLMPASLQIWDYQRDLVRVRRTSVRAIQRLANRGFQWTFFEFRWLIRQYPDASVTYERNGVAKSVKRVGDDPDLMIREPSLMRKMLKFRPIPIDWTRQACIH